MGLIQQYGGEILGYGCTGRGEGKLVDTIIFCLPIQLLYLFTIRFLAFFSSDPASK